MKNFDFFDHDADIGIIGRGATVEEAFEAAAQAVFSVMSGGSTTIGEHHLAFDFEESDPELALVSWLNRLLAEARSEGLVLNAFRLARHGDRWQGEAWGEKWRRQESPGVEVKGATLTMLSVGQTGENWEARCVVDV